MGLFSKGGSAPQPPDPYDTADAQTQMNIQTAIANARMNRTNQTTPWGSINWTEGPVDANGVPTYSSNVTLSPQQQALLDALQNQQLTRGGMAADLLRQMQGTAATRGLDFSSLPALHGFPELTAMHQRNQPQGGQSQTGGMAPPIGGPQNLVSGTYGQAPGNTGGGLPQGGTPNVNKPGTLMPSVGSATQGDPISGMGADAGAQGAAPQGRISVDPQSGMLMLDGQVLDRNDPRLYGSRGPQNAAVAEHSRGEGVVDPAIAASQYWDDMQTRHAGRRQLDSAGVSSGQEGQGFGEFNQNYLDSLIYDDEYGFLARPEHVDNSRDPDDRTRMQRQFAVMMAGMGGANALGLGQGAGVNAATGAGLGGSAGEAAAAGGMGSQAASVAIPPDMIAEITQAANPSLTSAPGSGMWETFTNYMRNNPRNAGSAISALLSMGGGGGGGSTQAAPRTRSSASRQAIVRRPSGKAGGLAQLLRKA